MIPHDRGLPIRRDHRCAGGLPQTARGAPRSSGGPGAGWGRVGVDAVAVLWKVNGQVPAPLFRARRNCLQLPHAHALRALRPLRKKVGLRSAVAVEMRNRSSARRAAAMATVADAAAAAGR